jgi:hypothetical protein
MLARPMRGPGVLWILVVVFAVVVTMFALGVFSAGDQWMTEPVPLNPSSDPPPVAATPGTTSPGNTTPQNTKPGPPEPAPTAGLVATRALATPPVSKNLADAPTAFLRVIDHTTERPIAGAPVRTVAGGTEIAFTDDQGMAPVALREPEQLAVVVAGYLLRLVPTRLHTTEAEPQLVRLVRDEWSLVRRITFTSTEGTAVHEAFVRFRPTGAPSRAPSPVPADDPVLQRAWTEHGLLASRPVCADVPVQLGVWSETRVHRLANDTDVRFLAPGEFTIEAATTTGLVAQSQVRIDAKPRTGAPPLTLRFEAGGYASGTVIDVASGTPVAGAAITLQGGEPLGLLATSAPDGTFRLGPLAPGRVSLNVSHDEHELLAFGPVQVPLTDARIMLKALSATALRGRVRTHPSLQPLAGATVQWVPPHGSPLITRTGADGTFVLRASGNLDGRLAVHMAGYLGYAELVSPGAPFQDYDLWPSTTAERLATGLSALLEGTVADAEGRPVADAEVRWQPVEPASRPVVAARRVLEGALLDLALATRTGPDGAFKLETNRFGAGRLSLAGSTTGLDVTAVAGQTKNGLRLQR